MTKTEFIPIDFRLIDESPLNPRRFITNESVKELSQSIAQQGLLQPITVRPFHAKKIEAPKELVGQMCYQIVCGARRYRACVLAGLKVIPAIVREITDEEAFDAMITENLQRKDVEPMDEARAFNELHKRGTSFEELAARFGKSVSFIRVRIKLNDLIPELVDLLEKKELQISHAQELCKLAIERQKQLFSEKYSENAHSYGRWTDKPAKEIKVYLQNDFTSLNNAIFDKADCANCQFRCGANDIAEENEKLLSGFQKAILINYTSIDEVIIKPKDDTLLKNEDVEYKLNILELENKNNRNLQLRDEKRIDDLRKLMSDNCETYRAWNYDLTEIEKAAMYAIILNNCSYDFKRKIEKDFDSSVDSIANIEKLINTPVMNQIIRAFICTGITDSGVTHNKIMQSALRAVTQSAFYDDALRIELKHEETYLKRKENIDKQLKELSDANTKIR